MDSSSSKALTGRVTRITRCRHRDVFLGQRDQYQHHDSVVDVLTTSPYTRVGNSFTLVEFVRAGNYSMATYIATNIQNFPDPNTDPVAAIYMPWAHT